MPGTKCRMDGFNLEEHIGRPKGVKLPMYVYVPGKETPPYFDMAHEWVLSDRTFQSQLDESFVAHQYAIAGQAASSVNVPFGLLGLQAWATETFRPFWKIAIRSQVPPCFNYRTWATSSTQPALVALLRRRYGDRRKAMAASGRPIRPSPYLSGTDWKKDVITPNWHFITDVRAGKLDDFTWITPVCKTPTMGTVPADTARRGSRRW